MFPIGAHTWCRVLEMPSADQLQAQIISRAMKLLRFCPIIPAHRKPPWLGTCMAFHEVISGTSAGRSVPAP